MKKLLLGLTLLLTLTALALAQGSPTLDHTPVATAVAGQAITIQVKTTIPASDISSAVIEYRKTGEPNYHEVDLLASGDMFRGEIPGSSVTEQGIEYYIAFTTKTGSREMLPPSTGAAPTSPFSVTVRSEGSAPAGTVMFQMVSPDMEEPQPVGEDIVISVAVLGGELDAATARLEVDGAAVTKWATVTPELISYLAKDLTAGPHVIRISGSTKSGLAIAPIEASFKSVKVGDVDRARTPFVFHGNAWEETRYENIYAGSNASGGSLYSKNTWQREGMNFNGRYGKLDFGGRFYITNEEKSNEQPRNRYQVWLGMKWWKLGLGDNQPDYTPLTVSGIRVRGLQVELHGGPAHLEFATGKTTKALDDFTNGNISFERELTTFRNWYGSKSGNSWGFTFVKTQDIRSSTDSAHARGIGLRPQENLVLGTDMQFAFDNRRIIINGEAAGSMYNRDISPGAVSKDSLKKLGFSDFPFDPKNFENLFVINQNMPLDMKLKTNLAYTFGVQLNYYQNILMFKYRTTGSSFFSFGSPSIVQDDAGINISDRVRLLDNHLYMTVGYETARNNLDDNSITGTVKQGYINFNVSYYSNQDYVPDVSLMYRNGSRKNNIDSVSSIAGTSDNRVNENLSNMTFYVAKTVRLGNYDHSAALTINTFKRDDKFTRTAGSPFNSASNMYNLNWKTKWLPDFSTTITLSSMKSENPVLVSGRYSSQATTYGTYGVRGDKDWLNKKLQTFLAVNIQNTTGQTKFDKTNFSLGSAYQFQYQITARMQADFYSTKASSTTANETFAWLRLEKTF